MKIHDVVQGSTEWHALRSTTYNASDAPAMLGCSPYQTRSELIKRLATGIAPEVDAETQRRFDDGHRFEALARPLAVEIIGEELYPISGSEDFGLDKPLGASLDGCTITDEILWEHKSLNDELRAILPEQIVGEVFVGSAALGAKLAKVYRVQMEQQLMISGAQKVLFTASKWNRDDTLVEARHCWYESDPALRAEILAGWKQLAEDVKAYVPPATSAVEKIVAEPVEALPAPVVKVTGQIALVDNFKAFEERLREFLADKLIREPKTDEDFVNLDGQIRAMKAARESLKAAEAQMLAQVQPVDMAKKTKDMLDDLLQKNVSMAEKILGAEKERRKGEIVAVGVKGLADHIASLNQRLGKAYMPPVPADFGGAVRGLKSLTSMEDKVATELARAKIAASEIADKLQKNLEYLREHAADFKHLFPDTEQIIGKAHDDLQALVQNRITAHKQAEEKRLEAERARIREEEERKANEKAQAELAARQAQQQSAAAPTPAPAAAPAAFTPVAAAPVKVNPVPPAANDDARIKLDQINERIAPLSITADGLAELGFPHVGTAGAAKLYRESDYPRICEALIQHLTQVADLQAA
jgi:predicted phage-related endonuclease